MEPKNKICPLFPPLPVQSKISNQIDMHHLPCRGDMCAFWDDYNKQCSIASIANLMVSLINELSRSAQNDGKKSE